MSGRVLQRCGAALLAVSLSLAQTPQGEAARRALAEGRYQEAVTLYRGLVEASPNEPSWHLNLAVALEKEGRPAEAVQEARWLTRSEPGQAAGWLLLGLAYQQLNQPAQAIGPLREASRLNPRDRTALFELGDAELATGSYAEAVVHFGSLTERDAQDAKAWEGLIRAYLSLGETAKAEKSLERLNLLPPSSELHALAADAYGRLNRKMDAVAEWRSALELSPASILYKSRLAEALMVARIYPEAQDLLVPLVKEHPENGEWQYLLGNVCLQQKQNEDALPHLEVAVRLRPAFLPAEEALGRAYLELGRAAEAVIHLERARPLDDGSISFSLANAYRKLGRAADSAKAMERYRELSKSKEKEGAR